ncbi:MAG TPA: ImmA/IrrE family metallo-endopeptidase [Gemmataceae bacterium]|nr:ImmA/IrrE family metallo-endopeptidase [Gemmataceae bacterium]
MSAPLWVAELAAEFWRRAGAAEPFPRRLRAPLARGGFELAVRTTTGLTVRAAEEYLARLGVGRAAASPDRPLRACLVAFAGSGLIFLDANDSPAEQTFSLAHEVAHFLRDYWRPRLRAVTALGAEVLQVLDGARLPRTDERLHAVLRGAPVGAHVHLMARDEYGMSPAVAAAERDADRLAFELLAPDDQVRVRLAAGTGATEAAAVLRDAFGLSGAAAETYAEVLFPPVPPPDPLLARLRAAAKR